MVFPARCPDFPIQLDTLPLEAMNLKKSRRFFLQKIRTVKKNRAIKINQPDTIELIQEEVSKFFDLKVEDLKSGQKQKRISRPRQIAMFLSRKYTPCSFPEIGRKFGGKNHSTVVHAVKKHTRENQTGFVYF